jgi:hypothetical protein
LVSRSVSESLKLRPSLSAARPARLEQHVVEVEVGAAGRQRADCGGTITAPSAG